jgi:hypothetical protein
MKCYHAMIHDLGHVEWYLISCLEAVTRRVCLVDLPTWDIPT